MQVRPQARIFTILCQRTQENILGFTGNAIFINHFAFVLARLKHFTFYQTLSTSFLPLSTRDPNRNISG